MPKKFYEENILKFTRNQNIADKHAKYLTGALIAVLVFLLLKLGSWLFDRTNTTETWQFMPETAVMAVELPELPRLWYKTDSLAIWNNLREIPYFEGLHGRFSLIDSLNYAGHDIEEFFKKKSVFASVHLTSNQEFDYIFYIPYKISESGLLKELMNEIKRRFSVKTDQREYHGITIYEVFQPDSDERFSYILHQNHLIGSFTPLLIEDVIRTVSDVSEENFVSGNMELFKLKSGKKQDGKIYLNMSRLPQILGTFTEKTVQEKLKSLTHLSNGFLADFSLSSRRISFLGKSVIMDDDDDNSNYLSVFKDQDPSEFESLTQFIPRRTALLFRWGFDNGEKLYNSLKAYRENNDRFQANFDKETFHEFGVNPAEIMENAEGEIALTVMENFDEMAADQLIFIRINDPRKVQGLMWQLAQNAAMDDAIFENYGDLRITRIDVPEIPQKMFGNLFGGFQKTWFSIINNYLILSNSVRGLKMLSDDLDKKETWAHLPKQTQMMELSDSKSNVCVKINVLRAWNTLTESLTPERRQFFEEFKRQILRFEFFTYQMTVKRQYYETHASLVHRMPQSFKGGNSKNMVRAHMNVLINKPIIPPIIVRNHHSKNDEVIIQDEYFNVYQIAHNGAKRWKTTVNGKIVSPIYQIDYYKNGKIQYLFATTKSLYLIDRLGQFVGGYPLTPMTPIPIDHLSVFDLDNLRNYKFALTDQAGNIRVYSKFRTPQEAWFPKPLSGTLVEAPRHIRVEGTDYILTVRGIGIVDALTITAKTHEEFPLDFGVPISNPAFLQLGDNPQNSYFTILTDEGELIKMALSGQIMGRNKLPRITETTDFSLCLSQPVENDYVIARHDGKTVTFLEKDGSEIFRKTFSTKAEKLPQYFSFGANTKIFTVTDQTLRKTWLYYSDGGMIYNKPLDSDMEIGLRYSDIDEVFEVYKNYGRKTEMLKIIKQ